MENNKSEKQLKKNTCYESKDKESLKKKFKKILAAIAMTLILILSVLASIGISSLTGDYNYFTFTAVGIVLIGIALVISLLVVLIKRKITVITKN